MLKVLFLTAAMGVLGLLSVADANALPLAQSNAVISQDSGVTLVRDGCGRGMRFSRSRGHCVRDVDVVPIRPFVRELVRPHCGRHMHWSNRRGRCVFD